MTKIIGLFTAAMVAVGLSTTAKADISSDILALQQATIVQAAAGGLNWRVGDKASYSVQLGGFIKGKSDNFVREDTGTGFWMVQDMDLMIQKSKVEILINKSTGQIEKLLVDGKEQSVPKSDQEILEMKESQITVPAGTFQCIYAKIKEKSDGKITEAWINPKIVPMSGLLKAIGESQFGQVIQEATSFSFAQ